MRLRVVLILALAALACSKKEGPVTTSTSSTATTSTTASAASETMATAGATGVTGGSGLTTEPSLISFSAGALIVAKPEEYSSSWGAIYMLDENHESGWATPKGTVTPQVMTIALPEKTELDHLIFDTGSTDGDAGRGAKDVSVEISDASATDGFQKIADVTLADRADNQTFPTSAQVPGRWLRVTFKNNHGSPDNIELMDLRGTGRQLTHTPVENISGTYDTNYNKFHIRQEGNSVTGCYEYNSGIVTGGVEGRVLKFQWKEGEAQGPAIMVLSPDGKQLFGLWSHDGDTLLSGQWNGTKISNDVGSCPHWSGSAAGQMAKDLSETGRARIYGINFDTDSDHIRDDSKATLDQITSVLKTNADWKMTIEGHTDSTATAEHNQQLSERRANAVKSYLQTAGIDPSRLTAAGIGATKPVASNDTAIGRAQNRRVELVKS